MCCSNGNAYTQSYTYAYIYIYIYIEREREREREREKEREREIDLMHDTLKYYTQQGRIKQVTGLHFMRTTLSIYSELSLDR